MASERTCGEALIELLAGYGVDTVFGIPGVHTLDFYRALAENGPVRHVRVRHEQGAGFMADGYARVTGRPGVCLVISGPGVTNAATALGQAWGDSVPLLMISAVTASASLGKGWGCLHEVSDQRAVTAPLTALSAVARVPGDVPELIGQAFTIFSAGRPRPVHIAVPIDVLAAPVAERWVPRPPPSRPAPAAMPIAAAAEVLAHAERPLLWVGGGAIDAAAEARSMVERLDMTVVSSNAGKGVVPDSHPANLGASSVLAATRAHVAEADAVLAVGTELAETDSFVDRLEFGGALVRVDIDPRKLNDLYPAAVGIAADAAATLTALDRALAERGVDAAGHGAAARAAEARRRAEAEVSANERRHLRALAALRAAAPADAVLMGDITQIVYTGSFGFPVEAPRRWCYPGGFCTLGPALPMAIGARVARPEQPVIALAGDGGFQFTFQELVVAVELGLPIPVVIWNNDGLGQIRDDMVARGIPPTGVGGRNPDFLALAHAYGCDARRVESAESFERAIRDALDAAGPTVIELRADASWLD